MGVLNDSLVRQKVSKISLCRRDTDSPRAIGVFVNFAS